MAIWAIILYILEVLSLVGALAGLGRTAPIKVDNTKGVIALLATALGFFALYELTTQSAAEHATALGVTYALISVLALPSFFATWAKGSVTYTPRRTLLVSLSSVVGIVLISLLAFAG